MLVLNNNCVTFFIVNQVTIADTKRPFAMKYW